MRVIVDDTDGVDMASQTGVRSLRGADGRNQPDKSHQKAEADRPLLHRALSYFVPPFFFSSSGFISSGSCAFNASSLGRSL